MPKPSAPVVRPPPAPAASSRDVWGEIARPLGEILVMQRRNIEKMDELADTLGVDPAARVRRRRASTCH